MKVKSFAVIEVLLLLVTMCFSVYRISRDSIENINKGYESSQVMYDELTFINWNGADGQYVSGEDPQIVMNGLDRYVHNIKISGDFSADEREIQIFFTTEPGQDFCEDNSLWKEYVISNHSIYINVDRYVSSLRLDLTNAPETNLELKSITVNDRALKASIYDMAKYSFLPVTVLGIIVFLIIKRKEIIPYAATMKKYMPLLGNLISRDLKVKYRRSVLGFLWSILNPLLMALVMNMVFSRLFRFQVEYFATYYLIGSLIFNFVVECTSGSLMSVIHASALIKKVYIPKYIFPMEKCAFAFINMIFGTFAVVVVMLIQGVPFTPKIFLFFIPMLYALVFAFGLGLVLAALTVFFRDVEHLYSVWVTIWMYLTPIIYPEELVASTSVATIMKCNPMYYYVHMLRSVVMYGTLPSLNEHIVCIAFSLMMLVFGLGLFKKVQDKFILYI